MNAFKRRIELNNALDKAFGKNFFILFATFTVPHIKTQTPEEVLKLLKTSFNRFSNCRKWKDLRNRLGYVGQIKCFDATVGANGFHPHYHILLFFTIAPEPIDFLVFDSELRCLWSKTVEKFTSLSCNREVALRLDVVRSIDSEAFASYSAGSLSSYLSAKNSIFTLLDEPNAADDFLEIFTALKGTRFISFSRGLKSILGISSTQKNPDDSCYCGTLSPNGCIALASSYELRRNVAGSVACGRFREAEQMISDVSESPCSFNVYQGFSTLT